MAEKVFLEKELSYRLVGCFYQVRNMYGIGHREKFYYAVLDEAMISAGLPFTNKPSVPLYSVQTGKKVSMIIPDKLVSGKIIVEIKAKPFTSTEDLAQVREYLHLTPYEILYLVNFTEAAFSPRRFIYTNDRKPFLQMSREINQYL